jgi:ectoine hydroxylase
MKLSQDQIDFYNEKGYLIIEDLFTEEEINRIKKTIKEFENLKELPNVICEKNGQIRSIFAPHKHFPEFKWLYLQDRIARPAQQLIGNPIYLYQYKLNTKRAFGGDLWEWHQDFPYWHLDDGVKLPNMVSAMILLQETKSIHGPLIIIPGSHKEGVVDFEYKKELAEGTNSDLINSLSANLKYTVKKNFIEESVNKTGFVTCEGGIGTCVFFHPNVFHSSNLNLSPFDRDTAIITFNDINNLPGSSPNIRPDYLCSREFNTVETGSQD